MSSEKYNPSNIFKFDAVWARVSKETDIKNQNDLAIVVGVSQGAVSGRKNKNTWPEEWAYRIATKYDLLTEWLLTGKGPKSISEIERAKYNFEILQDLDQWLSDLVVKEPYRREWFKASIEDAFPMFKEWKKRREGQEGDDPSISNENIA